jgi:hypothetical protein
MTGRRTPARSRPACRGRWNMGRADHSPRASRCRPELELASPGSNSRILTSSTSESSPTVRTTSLKNFCRSLSVNARSPSRANVSCWRARIRTSADAQALGHVPAWRICTAAPSCTMAVTNTSNQRSSRSDRPVDDIPGDRARACAASAGSRRGPTESCGGSPEERSTASRLDRPPDGRGSPRASSTT